MPEPAAATRNKRSLTMSKIGRIFGVHEKDKAAAPTPASASPVSRSSPTPPPTAAFNKSSSGSDFSDSQKATAKAKPVGAASRESCSPNGSSTASTRLNSANGSTISLNKLDHSRPLDGNHIAKKLNNLNVASDEDVPRNHTGINVGRQNETIPEEDSAASDQSFANLTSVVSNPNISSNVSGVKTRANRSRSVSKNGIRSKDSLKDWLHTSGSELNSRPSSRPSRSPKPKNTSDASLHTKERREAGNGNGNGGAKKESAIVHNKGLSKLTGNTGVGSGSGNNASGPKEKDKSCGRLKILEDGAHEHFLKSAKRQEKLSTMIKNFLGAKKLRDESVSAVSNILPNIIPDGNVPPSLMSGLMNKVHQNENGKIEVLLENELKNPNAGTEHRMLPRGMELQENLIDPRSFAEKYGSCQEVIGRGTFGVVKISHKKVSEHKENLYAVKEFRRRSQESEKEYSQRLAREFCISSSLKNIHIIQALDLLQDAKGDYCEVMEFCTGGDLYTLIVTAGKLEYIEADCFFKQIVRGVSYMHTMGVAHRDIKPENILLTADGNLKITDFGTSECFSYAWESKIHLFHGVTGSAPYIAPELYSAKEYDLRPADVWACGVVYMAMRTGRQLWRSANANEDEFYQEYLKGRKDANGYLPIETLKRARCRNVIYSILDPVPGRRITAKQILNSEWGREIKCCDAGEHGTKTDNIAIT